jgi:hypothetical protein
LTNSAKQQLFHGQQSQVMEPEQVARAPTDVRSLARSHTESAIRQLAVLANRAESESARVMACIALLDRGWGKAPQAHTGEDGEGAIRIVVRHIISGQPLKKPDEHPLTIDHVDHDEGETQ